MCLLATLYYSFALHIRMNYVPDEQEVLETIVKAFEKTGLRGGLISISLTEYSEDVVKEDTPSSLIQRSMSAVVLENPFRFCSKASYK